MENYLDLAKITYLDPADSRFYVTPGGFPGLEAVLPEFGDDLEQDSEPPMKKQDVGRVWFHRCFPFETPDEYISVLNRDGREYAMIRDVNEFPEEAQKIIRGELERKYFCPVIKSVSSLKEKLGYSYWKVETDRGPMEFSCSDTYRSIARVGGGMLIITDVDGNRYRIDDYALLDRRSYKRIELYL